MKETTIEFLRAIIAIPILIFLFLISLPFFILGKFLEDDNWKTRTEKEKDKNDISAT
jgi:hypothetical protein